MCVCARMRASFSTSCRNEGRGPLDLLNPPVPDPTLHLDPTTVLSTLGKHLEQGTERESHGFRTRILGHTALDP